jgi:hypothetical protein
MTRDDKRRGATFAAFADHFAREDAGGRFSAVNEFIAQTEVPQFPRQPLNSPWRSDPVPDEPPTGVAIDAMPGQVPNVSEPGPSKDELIKEIARLRAMLEAAQSGAGAPAIPVERLPDEGDGRPVPSPSFSNQKEK